MVIGILIYSYLTNDVPEWKLLMSQNMKLALGVEIVLLKRHFYVNVSATGLLISPG